MSIASEITRLQNSKADVKTQVNIDKDIINGGTAFVGNETLDDYDDKIKEMQEAYKKFIPIQTETGTTSVTIDNTAENKAITDMGLYGNTEQFTTTGRNLMVTSLEIMKSLNRAGTWNNNVYTWNGLTFTVNDDLSVTLGGTFSTRTYFYFMLHQTYSQTSYILSGCPSGGSGTTYFTAYGVYSNGTYYSGGNDSGSSVTIDISNVASPDIQVYIDIRSGGGIGKTFYPMLRLSSVTDATYEPYTNGASPNPDYPQEVKVVTGDNAINIYGKNRLKLTDAANIGYVLSFNIADGVIRITGTGNGQAATCSLTTLMNLDEINLIPNGTKITFSVLDIEGLAASQIFLGKVGNNYWLQPNATTKKVTVTKDANISGGSIWFQTTSGTEYDITIKPMLEIGEEAHHFEEYRKTTYPISLGVKNFWQPSEALSGYLPQSGSYPTTDPSYPNSRYILVPLIKGQSLTINNQGSPTSDFRMRYIDVDTNLIIGTVRQGTNGDYVTSTQDYALANYNGTVTALKNVILGLWDFTGTITSMIAVYGTSVPTISDNPIELAKISTYKDYIKRSTGKNLFDKNTTNKLNANYSSGVITANANERMAYIECEPNTTYTLSKLIPSSYIRNTIGTTQTIPADGVTLEDAVYSATSPKTFTTNANAKYLVWLYWSASDTQYTEQQTLDSMQIELGSSATSLEPYGKGKWYTYKATGKVVLDGTESWNKSGSSTSSVFIGGAFLSLDNKKENNLVCISDYFQTNQPWLLNNLWFYVNGTAIGIGMDANTITDITAFTNWLTTHNTTVRYPLAVPNITEITNTTLINQLEAIHLVTGTNVIEFDGNTLVSGLDVNYIVEANPHL